MKTVVTFENFMEQLRQAIKASGYFSEYDVQEQIVTKQGKNLHGIVFRKPGHSIAPVYYHEDFFESFQRGKSVAELCRKISEFLGKTKAEPNLWWLSDWNEVKGKLYPKLVNIASSSSVQVPNRIKEDMVIQYIIFIDDDVVGKGAIMVDNELLRIWNKTEEDVYQASMENVSKEKIQIFPLFNPYDEEDDIPRLFIARSADFENMNGARALLCFDKLKSFAIEENKNFWVLPASTEEIILIDESVPFENVKVMIESIYRDIFFSNVKLSTTVFRVDKDGNELETIHNIAVVS